MSIVPLFGCTAEPLGNYLKALAVLRLVSEQEDADAHGWWDGGGWFCLESKLDERGLVEFFEKRYRPTPILAPWNGGSGFYAKDRKRGIEAIGSSVDSRFEVYRRAIVLAREIPEVVTGKRDIKDEEARRTAIQLACRNGLPDECVDWLDAAIGISAEGERFFPPILGTGGNDGRLDYTNNFMERVSTLLLTPGQAAEGLLRNSLFGEPASGLEDGAVGQYDPGRAGGFNQGEEVETKDIPTNPWNFVLTIEGAVSWAAGLYRRQGVAYRSFLCSPFTVRVAPVGYGSASAEDRGAARAEIWAPVWERPTSFSEIRALLREGRAALDGKPARTGIEFAEAACMLGVDRGISGFVRFNLLMRRGKSYIALPAGRFRVEQRSEADLIRDLGAVLDEIDRRLRKDDPPWYQGLRRGMDEAMYACLLHSGADGLRDVATATGRLMQAVLLSGKIGRVAGTISPEWIKALGSVLPEARIAAAIAGMWQPGAGEFRDHLDRGERAFAWTGGSLAERMARALERRLMRGQAENSELNPLRSRCWARIEDAVLFLEGSVDDGLLESLLFAFTLVDWKRLPYRMAGEPAYVGAWPVYGILKHLFLSSKVETPAGEVGLKADLNVLSALASGDMGRAAEIATRRLENAGCHPPDVRYTGGFDGMRMAASLLIPVPYGRALKQFCTSGERV